MIESVNRLSLGARLSLGGKRRSSIHKGDVDTVKEKSVSVAAVAVAVAQDEPTRRGYEQALVCPSNQ